MFLALDRTPNAYTYGDTDIFIVINSGLLETLTATQIETVIAHECGHIICHHTLYHSMGSLLLSGADLFAKGVISTAIITSLKYAFAYWMRCSEFSADRVSAYYNDSPEPVIDLMMAFSGGTPNLKLNLNHEAFFKQAENYKMLVDNSSYNKILEFIQFGMNDHPLNAYRAYEINEFYKQFTAQLTFNGDDTSEENALVATIEEYTIRIKFEYIKPKGFLNLGGLLDNISLLTIIDGNNNYISKNTSKDIRIPSGQVDILFKVDSQEINYNINLDSDKCIVVTWNSNDKTLNVREEN